MIVRSFGVWPVGTSRTRFVKKEEMHSILFNIVAVAPQNLSEPHDEADTSFLGMPSRSGLADSILPF